jgi:prepilin-type processing-associated H-X9-DG protein
VTVPEVLVVVVIALLAVLFLLMYIPRQRELARLGACRRNLAQIGQAAALYDPGAGMLPAVELGGRGPLAMLLGELAVADFRSLDPKGVRARTPGGAPGDRPVPGFTCPSDRAALRGLHPGPVSYRATAGDTPDGAHGAFAPGRKTGFKAIEAADGSAYTALFAERLVGDGLAGTRNAWNYAVVAGPIAGDRCPPAPAEAWRGDAGSSWTRADWRSTLYTHAAPPGAPSACIARDAETALMGASSAHAPGVNVLFADLSVRAFTPRVDLKVWREWARVGAADPGPARPAP